MPEKRKEDTVDEKVQASMPTGGEPATNDLLRTVAYLGEDKGGHVPWAPL